MKKIIETKNAPAAIGPYSQAVEAKGFVFVSGQLPINPATGEMPDNIADQSKQSLENLKAILNHAGCYLDDVVKTTVYLANIADFGAMNDVYKNYFETDCPARAAFAVKNLPKGALVEIECIATK